MRLNLGQHAAAPSLSQAFWPAGLVLSLVLAAGASAPAQWLQWGGPGRNFMCSATGLADKWPEDGPRKIWSSEIGPGHSAILVDGDTLYTMCRRGDKDAVLAYDAATGTKRWETQYDAPTKPDMQLEFGPGPHATPLIVGDRIFTIGGMAHFYCLNKKTGEVLWMHDLVEEMGASHLLRGYGASPIAYNDLVILNVGGADAGLAAFKQDSGELAWKSERLRGGYSSPILVRLNGEDHLIVALAADRAGLDPATGKIRWRVTVDQQAAAIMSTPLWIEPDRVFFTAAYGGGSQLFRIGVKDGEYAAEELWHNKMQVMYADVIRIGGTIYGSSGDFGPAFLMATDLATGKIVWRKRGFGKASLLCVDAKSEGAAEPHPTLLIILDEEGTLALATASPDGLEIHAKAKVLEEKAFTVPTLVGTTLFLRDEHVIMALDLAAAQGTS